MGAAMRHTQVCALSQTDDFAPHQLSEEPGVACPAGANRGRGFDSPPPIGNPLPKTTAARACRAVMCIKKEMLSLQSAIPNIFRSRRQPILPGISHLGNPKRVLLGA